MSVEVLALFIVLGVPALVILAPLWLRSQDRRRVLAAMTAAAEKGATLPADQVSLLLSGARPVRSLPPDHVRDARRGALLLASALGIVVIAAGISTMVWALGVGFAGALFACLASVAALPAAIGAAYLLLARQGRRGSNAIDSD
jgi:hypothetical protein